MLTEEVELLVTTEEFPLYGVDFLIKDRQDYFENMIVMV